jgi:hypothetical protein
MFFPQLVAGPIERPQGLLPQFRERHPFRYDDATHGLRLILWGMFKKVVIADRLALFTDPVFNDPRQYSPVVLLLAAFFFSFQIFCDFSGYSDIAVGSARVMGFRLMQNFDRPYAARTVAGFWTRWHVSLSSWLRDYVYIPLGGNRVPPARWCLNIEVVFLLSGLWHGANWTFVWWGALHALYVVGGAGVDVLRHGSDFVTRPDRTPRWYGAVQVVRTFSLVTFAWGLFPVPVLADAFYIAGQLPRVPGQAGGVARRGHAQPGTLPVTPGKLAYCLGLVIFLEAVHALHGSSPCSPGCAPGRCTSGGPLLRPPGRHPAGRRVRQPPVHLFSVLRVSGGFTQRDAKKLNRKDRNRDARGQRRAVLCRNRLLSRLRSNS